MVVQLKPQSSQGFTYVGLMFLLVIFGITLAMTGTLWSYIQQREKEKQLLSIGHEFRHAIAMYYEHTPGVIKRYPNSLKELLQDNRYVSIQRYLRKIYMDPISGTKEWGIVSAPDGGVMGIYSQSENNTIKTGNFQLQDISLEGKRKYSDWKFVYFPKGVSYLPAIQ